MSLVFQNIDPPPPSPPGECVTPPMWGEDTIGGGGGWGSIFWKTIDIGLPSYSNNLSTPLPIIAKPPPPISWGGGGGGRVESNPNNSKKSRYNSLVLISRGKASTCRNSVKKTKREGRELVFLAYKCRGGFWTKFNFVSFA